MIGHLYESHHYPSSLECTPFSLKIMVSKCGISFERGPPPFQVFSLPHFWRLQGPHSKQPKHPTLHMFNARCVWRKKQLKLQHLFRNWFRVWLSRLVKCGCYLLQSLPGNFTRNSLLTVGFFGGNCFRMAIRYCWWKKSCTTWYIYIHIYIYYIYIMYIYICIIW